MKKNNFIFHTGPAFIIFLVLVFNNILFKSLTISRPEVSPAENAYNLDGRFLYYMALGNQRMLSGLLWVKTLLEGDTEKFNHTQGYEHSWMFYHFDAIAVLDPHFYENYLYGGIYLSIIKDDVIGAKKIYDKGLDIFFDDFFLLINAGFNYFYELGDSDRGIQLYERALSDRDNYLKNFPILPSLVTGLKTKKKSHLEEKFLLIKSQYLNSKPDSKMKSLLKEKLLHIRSIMIKANQSNTLADDLFSVGE